VTDLSYGGDPSHVSPNRILPGTSILSQLGESFARHNITSQSHDPFKAAYHAQQSRQDTIGSRSTDDEGTYRGTEVAVGPHGDGDGEGSQPDYRNGHVMAVEEEGLTRMKVEPEDDDGMDVDDSKMDHRKRKRNRTIRSCVPCHNHKRKVCYS